MKASKQTKYRVTPFNIKNSNKAPYFTVEPSGSNANKEEVAKLANTQFKQRSSLSKYPNWSLDIEKI